MHNPLPLQLLELRFGRLKLFGVQLPKFAMGVPLVEMKCSTPCDEGGSTLDALATSRYSSRMTLPKDPGSKAMNLGRAGGWSAAAAVTALAGWPLWLQPG